MAFGLFLLDSDNATDRNNITRNKRIKLERFGKIFKVRPARARANEAARTLLNRPAADPRGPRRRRRTAPLRPRRSSRCSAT